MNTAILKQEDNESEVERVKKLFFLILTILPAIFFSIFSMIQWKIVNTLALFKRPNYQIDYRENDYLKDTEASLFTGIKR